MRYARKRLCAIYHTFQFSQPNIFISVDNRTLILHLNSHPSMKRRAPADYAVCPDSPIFGPLFNPRSQLRVGLSEQGRPIKKLAAVRISAGAYSLQLAYAVVH